MNSGKRIRIFMCGEEIHGQQIGPDSVYIRNFAQIYKTKLSVDENMNDSIMQSENWVDRKHSAIQYRGKDLKRAKIFSCKNRDVDPETGIPLEIESYEYTGRTARIMLKHVPFREEPVVHNLVQGLQAHLEYKFEDDSAMRKAVINHCIVTRYVDEEDNIGFHQDKIRTMTPNSPIWIFSTLGSERREMHFANLKKNKVLGKLVMEPGSLLVLGPQTNATMTHSIVSGKDEVLLKRTSPVGTRISMVFRDIAVTWNEQDCVKKVTASIQSSIRNRAKKNHENNLKRRRKTIEKAFAEQLESPPKQRVKNVSNLIMKKVRKDYHTTKSKEWQKAQTHQDQVMKFFNPILVDADGNNKPKCYKELVDLDTQYEKRLQDWKTGK